MAHSVVSSNPVTKLMGSLERLTTYFVQKTKDIKHHLEIENDLENNPVAWNTYTLMVRELEDMDLILSQMRTNVEERKKTLKKFQVTKNRLQELDVCLVPHLNQLSTVSVSVGHLQPLTDITRSFAGGKSSTPVYRNSNGRIVESPIGESDDEAIGGLDAPGPTCSEIRKKSSILFMPSIEHLTAREFDDVPKYMKARLTLEQVNGAADELNKALRAKYAVMRTLKAKMTDFIRRTIQDYKDQDVPETKGQLFIVDHDISTLSRLKLDKNTRSILVILRHCGRIREIRGGGLARYVIT